MHKITQLLEIWFAHYMGNHRNDIFWHCIFTKSNCTLCGNNGRNTWSHNYMCVCLCLCVITHSSKGLVISRHNASTDQLVNLLNPCTRTKHFTPINPCTQNNMITPHRHGSFDGFAIPQDAHTLLN